MTLNHKIKVTIITGFLGSGKTTLINHLIRNAPEIQYALVENEFGAVSIDSRLIRGIDAGRFFELKNGCICCTIVNEYELVLKELAEKFPDVEELLIETTGIADPGQLIRPFLQDEDLRLLYDFRGIICVADCTGNHFHENNPVAMLQLVAAGAVILSKTDKLSPEGISAFEKKLRQINPFAEHFYTSADQTGFTPGLFWSNRPAMFPIPVNLETAHQRITSVTLEFTIPPDREKFEKWLSYLLDIYRKEIYRVKGIVYFQREPFEYIVQGVGVAWEITEGDLIIERASGILVFIGELDGIDLSWSEHG
jgi:G3E family GTPase